MVDLSQALQQHFGFEQFRPGQAQTISQLLAGTSSLAIFPTGSGKSLCYQLTALYLPNLTLVVSPLLALMKDQVAFLTRHGIKAASLDASLTTEENKAIQAGVHSGEIKILMVSVERFKNERFRQFIESVEISLLVVDEAHCISEWGHNFRPDYLKLPVYRQALNIDTVLLLTATATNQVRQDMADKFAIKAEHIVKTGFYRENLQLAVQAVPSEEKLSRLLNAVRQQCGAGIVYVTLQKTAEQVATWLKAQQVNAQAYHAGLGNERRQQIQEDFMADKVPVIVATIAFGMGIDKANIGFVIHYDLPKSIEGYSQEIGRAGRDGAPAFCLTLANLDGLTTVENFIYGDTPELAAIRHVLADIEQGYQQGRWELQLLSLANASNIRQLTLKTLLVQLELLGVIKPLYAYFSEVKIKLLKAESEILAQFDHHRQDFLRTVLRHVQFKRVWGQVDFTGLLAELNGQRDRVIAALDYLQLQGLIELETKSLTEVFQVQLAELKQEGLASSLTDYFSDKEVKDIARLTELVGFFQLDSCLSYYLADYFGDDSAPQSCGHCSVCQGSIAKLSYSKSFTWPSDEQLINALQLLQQHLASRTAQPLSVETACRFLAGIHMPLFTRAKVRNLAGYGICEQFSYQESRDKVTALWSVICPDNVR